MTLPIDEKRSALAPSLESLLESLRARIRRYIWTEGIACAAAWLGAAFWLSLAVDWFFEPPVPIRVLMLLAVLAALLWIVVKLIVRRASVPLTDGSMATVLERRFPRLGDSLLTAVTLGRRDPSREIFNPEMFEQTCGEAVQRSQDLQLAEVFDYRPMRRAILAASLLTASVLIFAIVTPKSFGTWACRTLGFSQSLWPRLCNLEIEGFRDGVRKVARGSDVEIVVRALPSGETFVVPREVEIRYREEGGARGRAIMDRIGGTDSERSRSIEFSSVRRNVLSPIRFDVYGGDASLRNLRIEVVENPTIKTVLHCKYPDYLGRKDRVTDDPRIPQGTRVTVRATANKPLEKVQVDCVTGDANAGRPVVLGAEQIAADRMHFDYAVTSLDKDTSLLFTLFDADGIKSREAIRVSLVAVPDQPPQIAAQLDGIGSAVTKMAKIPVAGRATDDYGVAKLWFEHGLELQEPAATLLGEAAAKPADAPTERNLDGLELDLKDFGLKPGQKIQICLKAADLCALGLEPNVGASERWLLDVVTPEQLRALLEGRELVLRQRFESIVRETAETRDLLAHANIPRADAVDSTSGGKDDKMSKDGKPAKRASDEPSDEPGETARPASPERRMEMLLLRVQSASTNCLKGEQETLGLADSFDDIRKQLFNNRIDTDRLNERLQRGIADPLRKIAGEMLPEMDRRLSLVQAGLEASKLDPASLDAARSQADAILLAMQQVLDRMLELEDYNQLVDLLRDVIKMQDQLRDQTEQRQKQKIRELLKE
jgi:hypothetical protein